ncbi:MAG: sugar phosphate isomerase/epimerase [Candidatus Hydrogenedentes bacterium]|nr:sugar phosphate isomerase/epimerase [Candidatus Hydrogenedentota bacterium]
MGKLHYAVHAYAWTNSWSNASLDIIDRAKGLGFDLVEVPLMEIEKVDAAAIKARAAQAGMALCTSTACSEATDPTGEDAATRDAALRYLKACIQATADMGATVFTGVTYSAIGRKIEGRPGEIYWERAAGVLKDAARFAQELGVTVGIEAINRYETFLVNTGDQGLDLIARIDEPNVRLHLDAYHMNIEEQDFYHPTLKGAPQLCHFHLSESHRGTPGTGTVDWESIYRGLAEAKYEGIVGLESFESVSPAMAAATCMWRSLADSSDQLLGDGLAYLKHLEAKHYG